MTTADETEARTRPHAAFAMRPELPKRLFGPEGLESLGRLLDIDTSASIESFKEAPPTVLRQVEVLITGWGSPRIDARELDRMPNLRAIIHAAGTVKGHVSLQAWERGILVTAAADANAIPVAEFTLAMILLAGKDAPELARAYHGRCSAAAIDTDETGNFGRTVGIVGASKIGRRVIELLQQFDFTVLLYDPLVDSHDPVTEHATLSRLDELFDQSSIVSIHAPLLPETIGLVGRSQLELLRSDATIINTARAAVVDQEALVEVIRTRHVRAILDVTDPEPLPADHVLRTLPGVVLTPHVAGAMGNELRRLGASAIDDLGLFLAGLPPTHAVTKSALAAMA